MATGAIDYVAPVNFIRGFPIGISLGTVHRGSFNFEILVIDSLRMRGGLKEGAVWLVPRSQGVVVGVVGGLGGRQVGSRQWRKENGLTGELSP